MSVGCGPPSRHGKEVWRMGQQGMAGGQAERSRSRRDGDEGSGERPQRISAGLLSALRLDAVGWALMSVANHQHLWLCGIG